MKNNINRRETLKKYVKIVRSQILKIYPYTFCKGEIAIAQDIPVCNKYPPTILCKGEIAIAQAISVCNKYPYTILLYYTYNIDIIYNIYKKVSEISWAIAISTSKEYNGAFFPEFTISGVM